MIQAVADKIVVEVMRVSRTAGGILLPDTVQDPQGYGKVVSAGELVTEGTNIKEGDVLVFHPRAGMDIVMNKKLMKVLKYEELYGVLLDESIKESLSTMQMGGNTEGQSLIQPVSALSL